MLEDDELEDAVVRTGVGQLVRLVDMHRGADLVEHAVALAQPACGRAG